MSFTAFWVYGLSELVVTLYYFHYWQNPDPAEVLFTDVVLLHLGAVCRIRCPFLAAFLRMHAHPAPPSSPPNPWRACGVVLRRRRWCV
jgi:hypothetical protein